VLLPASRYAKLLLDLSDAVGLGSFRDPKDVVEAIFGEAAEASIVTMQDEIESLCHNVRKQERKRDATAGTGTNGLWGGVTHVAQAQPCCTGDRACAGQ